MLYKCRIAGSDKVHQYEELIKVFLHPGEYEICSSDKYEGVSSDSSADSCNNDTENAAENEFSRTYLFEGDKDAVKRSIYKDLEKLTGKSPKWGIITGIRPVKMAGEFYKKTGSMEEVIRILREDYLLHDSKVEIITEILQYQLDTVGLPKNNSLSMYIGIPFCPTRCLYCSFTSNQVPDSEIERYLEALEKEIEYVAEGIREDGFALESIYMGGGTPTTLTAEQMDALLKKVRTSFDLSELREFTVEAGRPDTITTEKLEAIKKNGVGRISINPQTMKEETLKIIGRAHTVDDVEKAFETARSVGTDVINTDLIAGLPGETFEDFKNSLERILELSAENITLHTLAVKRASKLKELDEEYNYKNEELREKMLSYALKKLKANGYRPYYLYRQKHTSGNTENIGFCKEDTVSVYNIRIMEEAQSILALGAGGISKIYFPEENRLERVPNVSNYEIYIERIDEMIERKKKGFFGETVWR